MKKYLEFKFYKGSYFDLRYCCGDEEYKDYIMLALFKFQLMITLNFLPFRKDFTDYEGTRQYGCYLFSDNGFSDVSLWFWWGKKNKVLGFPWNFKWYKTSILLKGGDWEHESKGNTKQFYDKKWKDQQYCLNYLYTYKLISGEEQKIPTKIYVEKREWRRKAFMWTSLFNKVKKTIDVDFSKEVGEGKGSWKGGTIGCGYDMKKGEDAMQTIMRMERERRFNR